jgi:hypothetical protein
MSPELNTDSKLYQIAFKVASTGLIISMGITIVIVALLLLWAVKILWHIVFLT